MTQYRYTKEYWPDYKTGCNMEWCLTNGLGSYSSGSLIGSLNRTHQGYLVASLYPPTERFVTLERIRECIYIGDMIYNLDTAEICKNGEYIDRNGQRYLDEVIFDDASVSFKYSCGSGDEPEVTMNKTIAMKRNVNAVAIGYELTNNTDSPVKLVLTPLLNFREHNTLTPKKIPGFLVLRSGNTVSLVPKDNTFVRIDLSVSGGQYKERSILKEYGTRLLTQVALEEEGLTGHFTPFDMTVTIPANESISYSVLCNVVVSDSVESYALLQSADSYLLEPDDAKKVIDETRRYYEGLLAPISGKKASTGVFADYDPGSDDILKRLYLSADHFLCNRASTGTSTVLAGLPWFTDWGRDTMISFTGLTLCTGRYEEAGQILLTFAHYVRDGLIPNMFPDNGNDPLYNTADASLWFFVAVYRYIKYLKDDPHIDNGYMQNVLAFIRDDIFPALIDITEHYIKGTGFSIYMESNGLIHAGSDLDQVTWMDVRVDDRVMTPRHGCPVEINALWYNALCIMDYLCGIYGYDSSQYKQLASTVKSEFPKAFWNDSGKYLYDVVVYDSGSKEYTYRDTSIRPNQLIAVALPFEVLTRSQERAVVDITTKLLYVGKGIRSLAPGHADYHGIYRGALKKRDEAYHQGTAWAYLLGFYFTAYRRVNGRTKDVTEKLLDMLKIVMEHMEHEGAIGGICEVCDGDEPHLAGGCYNQAWSVAEILRSYVEDIRI